MELVPDNIVNKNMECVAKRKLIFFSYLEDGTNLMRGKMLNLSSGDSELGAHACVIIYVIFQNNIMRHAH